MIFRYFTGVDNAVARELAETHGVGLMLNPGSYRPSRALDYPVHAVDNGCFSGKWDERKWFRYLGRVPRDRCLFAVAPDVPFDWKKSWERSQKYTDTIRNMGFPVAVALQNGVTSKEVPWDDLDVVFIGGDTEWKLSSVALEITHTAHHHGVPVHMGRANSQKRFRRAVEMLTDSADGTFLKYGNPESQAARLRAMLDPIYALPSHQIALA